MSTIKIKCVDQVLTFTNTPVITTGDQNIDKMEIDFCPLWEGFVKVGIFFQQKGEFSYSVINADGSCPIPNSILKLEGKIYFAVSGTNSKNQVRTSNIVCYTFEEGVADAHIQDEFPGDISDEEKEDIYNKMLELVTEMQTLTQDLIRNFAYVRVKGGNEFSYDVSALQAQIRAYTYEKAVIDQRISELNSRINSTNGNLSNVNKTVSDNSAKITSITSDIDILSKNVSALNLEVDKVTASVSEMDTLKVNEKDFAIFRTELMVMLEEYESRLAKLEGKA